MNQKLTPTDFSTMLNAYHRDGLLSDEQYNRFFELMQTKQFTQSDNDLFSDTRSAYVSGRVVLISMALRMVQDALLELQVDKAYYSQEFKQQANKFQDFLLRNYEKYNTKVVEAEELENLNTLLRDIAHNIPKLEAKQWVSLFEVIGEIKQKGKLEFISEEEVTDLKLNQKSTKKTKPK